MAARFHRARVYQVRAGPAIALPCLSRVPLRPASGTGDGRQEAAKGAGSVTVPYGLGHGRSVLMELEARAGIEPTYKALQDLTATFPKLPNRPIWPRFQLLKGEGRWL